MSTHGTGLSDWEGPLVVKPKVAWKMLACSNTRGYELIGAGELDSFLDGRSRKITVDSIRRYIARRLAPTASQDKDARPRRRGRPRKTCSAERSAEP
jgi:hypothetical protein